MFSGDIIVCVENPKEMTKSLLELVSNYNKFARYNVNTQNLITFLYIINEQMEFEIALIQNNHKNGFNTITLTPLQNEVFGIL